MRFRKFLFKAFGPFTDLEIDLGASPGLHVIYGPNEAGKSSSLRAIGAMLFGIERSTPDNFLHENPRLRVGAELEGPHGKLAFLRKKGTKDTLVSANGDKVLGEDILSPFLRGSNLDTFFMEHAIDHDKLVAGGQALLDNQDDVGQSLFAAGHGITGIQGIISELVEEAEAIYTNRKRKEGLPSLIKEYRDIRKLEKDSSASSSGHATLERDSRKAEATSKEISNKLREIETGKARLELLQRAIPLAAKRSHLIKSLEALGSSLLLPMDLSSQRTKVEAEAQRAKDATARVQIEIASLEGQISKLNVPEDLLAQSHLIHEIHQKLGSYKDAQRDRNILNAELTQIESAILPLLESLRPGLLLPEAQAYRLGAADRAAINSLAGEHASDQGKVQTLEERLGSLQAKLKLAEERLTSSGTAADASHLRRILADITRRGDLSGNLAKQRQGTQDRRNRLVSEYAQLGSANHDLSSCCIFGVPQRATVEDFQRRFTELQSSIQKIRDAIARTQGDIQSIRTELQGIPGIRESMGHQELEKARSKREAGWKLVLLTWLSGKAIADHQEYLNGLPLQGAYERDVAAADDMADARFDNAGSLVQLDSLNARLTSNNEALSKSQKQLVLHESEMQMLNSEWQDLWKASGIPAGSPSAMFQWITDYQTVIQRHKELLDLEARDEEASLEVNLCHERLSGALSSQPGAPTPEGDLQVLVCQTEAFAQSLEEIRQKQLQLSGQIGDMKSERADLEAQIERHHSIQLQWQSRWHSKIKSHGFNAEDSPVVVLHSLGIAEDIFKKEIELRERQGRIAQIDKASQSFESELDALLKQVAPELEGRARVEAASRIHEAFGKAKDDQTRKKSMQEAMDEKHVALKKDAKILEERQHTLDAMCKKHGCTDLDALRELETRCAQQNDLRARISSVEDQLLDLSSGDLETLVKESSAANPDDITTSINSLAQEREGLEAEKTLSDQEVGSLRTQLKVINGGDAAAKYSEDAEALLPRIRAMAKRFITLKLAIKILQDEVESFRKQNETPLLAKAGALFPVLTRGSFSGLEISYDDETPKLVGVRPDGAHVGVEGMSSGTRDQMFLALRLAALETSDTGSDPLPFIVDDILITFDDDRAKVTLDVLKKLGEKTQVLFFTHQARHVELAKAIGGIHVHALPQSELAVRKVTEA